MDSFLNNLISGIISHGADNLMFAMVTIFVIGIMLKFLVFFLLRRELFFSTSFETRTIRYISGKYSGDVKPFVKFNDLVEYLLKRTYQESYLIRKKQNRKRKEDSRVALLNKVFLVEEGVKIIVQDTLRQTRYHDNDPVSPDFASISKFVFRSNPYFTKLWGFIPVGMVNNLFSILPSLFIIGGIFGTFLGISKGLPALKLIDPSDVAGSQLILRTFLESMTFAMYSSVVGILLSVLFTICNSVLSFNAIYLKLVDKFTQSLEILWKDTNMNRPRLVRPKPLAAGQTAKSH